jgi:anaerobic selenocysteine-containing dehydrogenase
VNMVFTQLWPYLSAYFTAQAHPQLDPLLDQNKPAWMDDIKLVKCAHFACRLDCMLDAHVGGHGHGMHIESRAEHRRTSPTAFRSACCSGGWAAKP